MDIKALQDAIDELEAGPATPENVAELSALYIVMDHISKGQNSGSFKPILPCYDPYIELKKEYQLGGSSEGAVVKSLKNLCMDLDNLLTQLYSNTDMAKERRCITEFIDNLHNKFHTI